MKYIQFIGTQRSGSNLLRVMLNQMPEVSAPHPPHILKTFFPLLPQYGSLHESQNFFSLVCDVCDWVNNNPVPWEDFVLSPDYIMSLCKQNTLLELFSRIYEQKALHDGATYWCCKSMESIHHVDEIESSNLHPFYVYIYRDGRDVALSFKKAIVGPKHIYFLAKKWKEEQELSLNFLEGIHESRFITVKYEELISKAHEIMEEISKKLNIAFTEDIFEYFHSHESISTANSGRMWKNLARPIMQDNYNKFKRELSQSELEIFEKVAGTTLVRLGYEMVSPANDLNTGFSKEELEVFKQEDDMLKRKIMEQADAEELKRRIPQEQILKRIKNRKIQTT